VLCFVCRRDAYLPLDRSIALWGEHDKTPQSAIDHQHLERFEPSSHVLAYDNGLGLKPFLGWQSWCAVGKCGTDACYDRQIRQTAKAMVDNGMKDLGFEWVVIDDCWCATAAQAALANRTTTPAAAA
jgi:hypothetical protein